MIKIPYGIGHFPTLRYGQYVYVDKTHFIEKMEYLSTRYLFLLRPRRFGKSLWVSILSHYYDIQQATNFDKLFGELYIGAHPTPEKNSYWILNFEFSGIDTKTLDTTYQGFFNKVKDSIQKFLLKYAISEEFHTGILNKQSPNAMLSNLLAVCSEEPHKCPIYVIIDEYDHFANEILAFHQGDFTSMVGRNGFVRKFYEVIKTGAMDGVVGRFFATGVTPITLDAMTSGFNITTDISRKPQFNEALGFTFEEVQHFTDLVCENQNCDKPKIFQDMKNWYNGYIFGIEAGKRIYNPDMVLYFLNELQTQQKYPENLLDTNIASDYGKIAKIFKVGKEQENLTVLQKLIDDREVSAEITEKFNFERNFTKEDLVSLLYYMGFLTIKKRDFMGYLFQMPNYVIESLYFDFFGEYLERQIGEAWYDIGDLREVMRALALAGNPEPLAKELQNALKKLSGREAIQFGEKNLKVVLVTLLNYSKAYFVKSEYESEKRFVDILLLKRPPVEVNYQYAIELKYLPKKDSKQKEKIKKEAIIQLQAYLQHEELQKLENLKAFVLLFIGDGYELLMVQ